MTVIRRPAPSPHLKLDGPEKARILIVVINSLRVLGEPATTPEIAAYARPRVAGQVAANLEQKIEAVLHQYSDSAAAPAEDPPFRRVLSRAIEAWAFSPSFRDALAESGLQIHARGAPPGEPES